MTNTAEKLTSNENKGNENKELYCVPDKLRKPALINKEQYLKLYKQSIESPEEFWATQANERIDWIEKWQKVKDTSFDKDSLNIRWFEGAKLNVCYNCVDRHLEKRGNKTAIIWEGDDPNESRNITYSELYKETCKFANVLKKNGVQKGDRVIIYMPMIPEAAYAMLACARIGAIHSVVFGGFSPAALSGRIKDCGAKIVITADEGIRGGKKVPLKANVDKALEEHDEVGKVIVVKRTGGKVSWQETIDTWYHEAAAEVSEKCEPETMNAEDPLFILYTSGSTGKPKGVLHTSGGYILYASITHQYIFDYHEDDIYWCTADVGWITGHSYIIYGPLANGATTLMFEGIPNHPDFSRFWQVIDKHKVSIFYTAPTAVRALMKESDAWVNKTTRNSLRLLGSVGEPINPAAWEWYYKTVGNSSCPIVDTWWQTETGGILISPLPGATDLKPGSATLPFFGVKPVIIEPQTAKEATANAEGYAEGHLCFSDSWPGQMRGVYGDKQRFFDTYFSQYPGLYFSGDGAKLDNDGYYWISGRVDDVINVSGHRFGTAEIESALVSHEAVAEAAVVGFSHQVKGQGIYAFVILETGFAADESLNKELINTVRQQIGAICTPDYIQFTPGLPKTRSGKIMRRILRKIVSGETKEFGDTGTLTNPEIIEKLVSGCLLKK